MPAAPSKGQIRAARAMLDWSLIDLARTADVSVSSVLCFEMRGAEALFPVVADRIQDVLEREGITFLADDGGGCGVRLRAVQATDALLEPRLPARHGPPRWFEIARGSRARDALG